ncbi:MAG: S49 family peptidase [Deltaproteobacteria bacterium]|nr:S49 family peptidase [Deltaproteobacteria bacterium]
MSQGWKRIGVAMASAPVALATGAVRGGLARQGLVLTLTVRFDADLVERADLEHALLRAARDPGVRAVILRIDGALGSWAWSQGLRQGLQVLREAGREVWAILEQPGHGALWVASAASRLFLLPAGEVHLLGVGAEVAFYKGALDQLGLEADLVAAGAYKSFGEPWQRTFASSAWTESLQAMLGGLQRTLVRDLAEARGLSAGAVEAAMAEAPLTAERALALGLVDALAYEDQVLAEAKERWPGARTLKWERWRKLDQAQELAARAGGLGPEVAVVHLEGPVVVDDPRRAVAIKARVVAPLLRRLREDASVVAVVLHLNTGGGSALASELIWREVDLLAAEKPVVAVFEGVCASGGYYLAAPAREIFSRSTTLTGSIGVFGGKLVTEGLRRKLGLTVQPFGQAPASLLYASSRRFTEGERARFGALMGRVYDGFVERVAKGRGTSPEQVEPHCRGRVWTGEDAAARGLVDRFGGLEDGLARAKELASAPSARRVDHDPSHRRTLVSKAVKAARGGESAVELAVQAWVDHPLSWLLAHQEQALAVLPVEAPGV